MKERILVFSLLTILVCILGGCKGNEESSSFVENLKIDKTANANLTMECTETQMIISSDKDCYFDIEGEIQLEEDNFIEGFKIYRQPIDAGETIKIHVKSINKNAKKITKVSFCREPYVLKIMLPKVIIMTILITFAVVLSIKAFSVMERI